MAGRGQTRESVPVLRCLDFPSYCHRPRMAGRGQTRESVPVLRCLDFPSYCHRPRMAGRGQTRESVPVLRCLDFPSYCHRPRMAGRGQTRESVPVLRCLDFPSYCHRPRMAGRGQTRESVPVLRCLDFPSCCHRPRMAGRVRQEIGCRRRGQVIQQQDIQGADKSRDQAFYLTCAAFFKLKVDSPTIKQWSRVRVGCHVDNHTLVLAQDPTETEIVFQGFARLLDQTVKLYQPCRTDSDAVLSL
ncbi:hypothetical protein RRG08_015027 [Elysia crispata]|uniref:Uncharacterized protein n=1 Tax=Elysia crispata TaxID=231223 RepID=A0AAE0ZGT9_9GAST|nr:hypothetical protein RRG08_015027 [Elysia crispata]